MLVPIEKTNIPQTIYFYLRKVWGEKCAQFMGSILTYVLGIMVATRAPIGCAQDE